MIQLDDLDKKALDHFRGFVVKKDLVGIIKGGANVPAFVLAYLLANTCSTEVEAKLQEGMENVKTILVPMDNLAELSTLPTSILGKTDVPFYGNSQMLLQKAVLGE